MHVGTVLSGVNGSYRFIELREIPPGRPTMMANQQTILIAAYVDYKRKVSNMPGEFLLSFVTSS